MRWLYQNEREHGREVGPHLLRRAEVRHVTQGKGDFRPGIFLGLDDLQGKLLSQRPQWSCVVEVALDDLFEHLSGLTGRNLAFACVRNDVVDEALEILSLAHVISFGPGITRLVMCLPLSLGRLSVFGA